MGGLSDRAHLLLSLPSSNTVERTSGTSQLLCEHPVTQGISLNLLGIFPFGIPERLVYVPCWLSDITLAARLLWLVEQREPMLKIFRW